MQLKPIIAKINEVFYIRNKWRYAHHICFLAHLYKRSSLFRCQVSKCEWRSLAVSIMPGGTIGILRRLREGTHIFYVALGRQSNRCCPLMSMELLMLWKCQAIRSLTPRSDFDECKQLKQKAAGAAPATSLLYTQNKVT